MFSVPMEAGQPPLVLELRGIPVPPSKKAKATRRAGPPNCHIPSKKNNKTWLTKLPNGKMLKRPLLITKPEYQQWTEKAIQRLELTLLSMCQTGSGETPPVRSRLFAILSQLPADDSVNDLTEGSWRVERCEPGREGATITITRLS